jgi:ketosteroid isomerase-like protein
MNGVDSPDGVIRRFSALLNARDVDGAVALYEPEAAFVAEPGRWVTGMDEIRAALERFAALEPELEGEIESVREAGGIALVVNRWSLRGRGPDGPVELGGRSADVLRRQSDGSWRVLIDDPWGVSGSTA